MRNLISIASMVIVSFSAQLLSAQEPLLPFPLLNWLRILDDDDYRLLSAVDQTNFYFSVRVDSDGDILFSTQDNLIVSRRNPRSFTLKITDLDGNDLHDSKSKKSNPKAIEIAHTAHSKTGVVETSESKTISYPAGVIYPLVQHESGRIRVRYIENVEGGKTTELFNQIITLPTNRGVTKR